MRLLFEPRDEPAGPLQCQVEIVDAKEQEEPVSWCRAVRTHQGGVLVSAPFVETEQDSSVRVEELTKFVVGRCRLWLAEERLVPLEARTDVVHPDDRPGALHPYSSGDLLRKWHLPDRLDRDLDAEGFERVDGAGPRPVDVAVLIVVGPRLRVLLPRGQDVVDPAQQGRRHGDYRERKEMSSRLLATYPPRGQCIGCAVRTVGDAFETLKRLVTAK